MNANDLTSIDQVCAFMSGTQRVVFEVAGDKQGAMTGCGAPWSNSIIQAVAKRTGGYSFRT